MLFLMLFFSTLVVVEFVVATTLGQKWSNGEFVPNIVSGAVGVAVSGVSGVVFAIIYQYVFDRFHVLYFQYTAPFWVAAFILYEFVHYWQHRLEHRVGFFWAFHSVHHSSEEMNVTVGPRMIWGGVLLEPVMLLMPFVGVPLAMVGSIRFVSRMYGMMTHTRVVPALGVLEYLLVTPSNHRAHHGRQPKYLDRNYGQTLIVFDQLFGTFQREQEAPSYGLVTPDPERNVLKFQVAGIRGLYAKIRSAPSFGARIGYLLRPPGWSHNGQHETAEALRARDAHRPGGTAQSAPGAAEVVVS